MEEGRRARSMSMEEYDVPNVRRLSIVKKEKEKEKQITENE